MSTFSDAHAGIAKEFAQASVATLTTDGSLHPGTVIAATARMAGTYLFRSFRLDLPGVEPGQAVLSLQANERAPVLIRIAAAIVDTFSIHLDSTKAGEPIDQKHEPRLSFLETQRLLEPVYRPIKDRGGLSDYDAARAAVVAAAMLIPHCAKVLEPNMAFRILSLGIVEGSKSAPDPVELP
jgi:hypothetical protein